VIVKDELCKAFCDQIQVRKVPAGLAVATGFDGHQGDPIGFYIVGPDSSGNYRIQDDGLTVFNLEAAGADIELPSRAEAFHQLLHEYGFLYDDTEHTLVSRAVSGQNVASSALRFVALLLRLQDILLMVQERAENTFKEEVSRKLRESIGTRAEILMNEPVHPKLHDYPADMVLKAAGRDPVAVFFGTSDQHLLEAIVLVMAARYEVQVPCKVVALLEKETSVTKKHRQQAANRLDALALYRGDENEAVARIVRAAVGEAALH
jgi:hypothetical protein